MNAPRMQVNIHYTPPESCCEAQHTLPWKCFICEPNSVFQRNKIHTERCTFQNLNSYKQLYPMREIWTKSFYVVHTLNVKKCFKKREVEQIHIKFHCESKAKC